MLDSSALPAPIPGSIYLGEPKPGDTYRLFLTADGFGTHVKLLGLGPRRPADRAARRPTSRTCRRRRSRGFDMHFFGSERGLLATPTQCGTYPVKSDVHALGRRSSPIRNRPSSSPLDSGPNGAPCPGRRASVRPELRSGHARQHRRRLLALRLRAHPRRRRSEPDRHQRHDAARASWPASGASPTARRRRSTSSRSAGYSGLAELASPACPAASQIGTAVAGAGAGSPPASHPGQGLPRRPLQGRAAQPGGRRPGRLRALRPRQRRRSGRRSTSTR